MDFKFGGSIASGVKLAGFDVRLTVKGDTSPLFNIQAQLSPTCQIKEAPNVDFNGYLTSTMTAVQNLQVRCTYTTPYQVSFSGSHDGNGWHEMVDDQDLTKNIRYQMYTDDHYTQQWNNSQASLRTGTGTVETIPIYYRTDTAQANQSAGVYQDQVTVTVAY